MAFSVNFKNKIVNLARDIVAEYNPGHFLELSDVIFSTDDLIDMYLPRKSYVKCANRESEIGNLIRAECELKGYNIDFFEKLPVMITDCNLGDIVKIWSHKSSVDIEIYSLGIVSMISARTDEKKQIFIRRFKFFIENEYTLGTPHHRYFYLGENEECGIIEIIPKENFTKEILVYYDYCVSKFIKRTEQDRRQLETDSNNFLKEFSKDFENIESNVKQIKLKEDIYRDYLPET